MSSDLAREALADTVTEFGSSRFGEYRRCPRAHHLRYERGIVLKPRDLENLDGSEGEPLYFQTGRIVHGVMRYMQEGIMVGETRDWRDVIEAARSLEDLDSQSIVESSRLMAAYFDHWYGEHGSGNAGWPRGAEIVAVEELLETRIGPSSYTGRIDTLLRIRDRLLIVDTKTRSKSFPNDLDRYSRGAATRPQFLGLAALCRAHFGQTPNVWINGIIKSKKAPKFQRVMVEITDEAVDQWAAEQARFLPIAGDDRMNYSSCAPEGQGRRCSYFEWCHIPQLRTQNYMQKEQNGS